mgnify:CR=1 FL=1
MSSPILQFTDKYGISRPQYFVFPIEAFKYGFPLSVVFDVRAGLTPSPLRAALRPSSRAVRRRGRQIPIAVPVRCGRELLGELRKRHEAPFRCICGRAAPSRRPAAEPQAANLCSRQPTLGLHASRSYNVHAREPVATRGSPHYTDASGRRADRIARPQHPCAFLVEIHRPPLSPIEHEAN